jgi:hypothetical protein
MSDLRTALLQAKGFIENAVAGGVVTTDDIEKVLKDARIALDNCPEEALVQSDDAFANPDKAACDPNPDAQLKALDDAWWIRLGKFRKALHDAGLHGHYNLLQEHFQSETRL